jgi:hypothetical protein
MTQYRSIIDTHNEMIKVIPENKNQLIDDLNEFIDSLKNQKENKLKTKEIYTSYLHVLLKHIPKRALKNSDPDWLWNCQEIFSYSVIQ